MADSMRLTWRFLPSRNTTRTTARCWERLRRMAARCGLGTLPLGSWSGTAGGTSSMDSARFASAPSTSAAFAGAVMPSSSWMPCSSWSNCSGVGLPLTSAK